MATAKTATPAAGEVPADLAAAVQAIARITANVAAQSARTRWTDFRSLLRDQYGTSPADVETFMDILAGRKP